MKTQNHCDFFKPAVIIIIIVVCFILIKNYFGQTDNFNLISRIALLGFPVFIIFIPYLIITASDTLGWYNSFGNKGLQIAIKKLFLLRLGTETLQISLPGGAAYAELVRPLLLKNHLNLDYPISITANIITKVNILIAQGLFLLSGLLIIIAEYKKSLASLTYLSETILYLTAGGFVFSIILFSYFLYCKNLLLHVINLLEKINLKMVRQLLNRIRQSSLEINYTLNSFYKDHKKKLLLTLIFFLFTWVLMAFESLLILKVIGIEADIFQMIALESLISLVRIAFFFLPGAAGPMDLSIIMIFNLVGVPDPLQNSVLFVILKRLKELFWIITGYIVLLVLGVEIKQLIKAKKSEPEFIS